MPEQQFASLAQQVAVMQERQLTIEHKLLALISDIEAKNHALFVLLNAVLDVGAGGRVASAFLEARHQSGDCQPLNVFYLLRCLAPYIESPLFAQKKQPTRTLHIAAKENYLDIGRALLVEHPEYMHQKDEYGYTPLHYAAQSGHIDFASLLLSAGAYIDACTEGLLRNAFKSFY